MEVINPLNLLTAKPVIFLINLSERDYVRGKNKHLLKTAEWLKANAKGDKVIPLSVSYEERLTQFESEKEALEEAQRLNAPSALPKVIIEMRKALHLRSFFTSGPDEVRQWTIREDSTAPQAAGVIHTDFEKTFVQVQVYNFETLKELGDEAEVKAKGKLMSKGKDYVVAEGDILYFKAGAMKGG